MIIRASLLNCLDSAQLVPSDFKELETIKFKGLRKISRLDTIGASREDTNTRIRNASKQKIEEGGNKKKVITFVEG